jgi:integrase
MGVLVRQKVKGSGVWWIVICYKKRRKYIRVGSRDAARLKAQEFEGMLSNDKLQLPVPNAPRGITFHDAADRWMREHVRLKLKPSAQHYYEGILSRRLEPEWGEWELAAIKRSDIKGAVARWAERGKGVRSIPNVLRTLRAIFAWAIEEDLVLANPVLAPSTIFKVDAPYKSDFLRPEEVAIYLDAVRERAPRYHPFFRLLIFGGVRLGEAIGLDWSCVDFNGRFIDIRVASWRGIVSTPKTAGSSRRVNLSHAMVEALKAHRRMLSEEALRAGRPLPERVFIEWTKVKDLPAEVPTPLDEWEVRKVHTRALKAAGLRHLPVHSLRSTYASLLASAGVPLFHVAKLLGHSDVATTERHYAALAPGALQEAPEVLERYVTEKNAPPARREEIPRALLEASVDVKN